MIAGNIIDDKPLLSVSAGWKSHIQDIIVMVDTGFTGELKVTPQVAKELGIETTDVRTVKMGDGQPVTCGCGLAFVLIEGIKKEVSVLITGGQQVIGVRLMRNFGYTLTADFPNNAFVLRNGIAVRFDE